MFWARFAKTPRNLPIGQPFKHSGPFQRWNGAGMALETQIQRWNGAGMEICAVLRKIQRWMPNPALDWRWIGAGFAIPALEWRWTLAVPALEWRWKTVKRGGRCGQKRRRGSGQGRVPSNKRWRVGNIARLSPGGRSPDFLRGVF